MHAVAHAVGFRKIAHLFDVPLQRVEVQNKAGCLDVGLIHAGQGRNVVANVEVLEVAHIIHGEFSLIPASRAVC